MKKIMAVDDDIDQLFTIKTIFEKENIGYKVITAKSGEECLELMQYDVPDLIILDILMPQMSGWEVFNEIKKNPEWKNIPIVFLTSRTDSHARNSGGFLGNDYIEKPFKKEDLLIRIENILKEHH